MARNLALIASLTAGLAAAAPAAAGDTAAPLQSGVWKNPKNSVHVELRPCGENACGYVVWANAKAQADARKGGTDNLIGMQLLRDFKPHKDGVWRGKVFVPDLNATFSGSAQLIDQRTMKARGCLIGSFGCKSQTWTRIDG